MFIGLLTESNQFDPNKDVWGIIKTTLYIFFIPIWTKIKIRLPIEHIMK